MRVVMQYLNKKRVIVNLLLSPRLLIINELIPPTYIEDIST